VKLKLSLGLGEHLAYKIFMLQSAWFSWRNLKVPSHNTAMHYKRYLCGSGKRSVISLLSLSLDN